ncbi:MAG: cell division protein ZapA [Tetragenococcus sp.]|nr:cell division protein ZapA [Tetragenococcus sp.]
MAEQKNRFKAVIEDQNYTIIGKESPKHMKMVTELVNDQLKEIKKMSPQIDNEQAAILLAINAVSDQLNKQEELLKLKEENDALYEKASKATELENQVQRIEKIEQDAKEVLEKQGQKDVEINNHVEAQQILNENRKQSIQQRVTQG